MPEIRNYLRPDLSELSSLGSQGIAISGPDVRSAHSVRTVDGIEN